MMHYNLLEKSILFLNVKYRTITSTTTINQQLPVRSVENVVDKSIIVI